MNKTAQIETPTGALERVAHAFGDHLPNLLAAILIALLGWLIAFALRRLTRFLAGRLQHKMDHVKWLQTRTQNMLLLRKAPALIAGFVFWAVLLFFLVAAIETLGLPSISNLLGSVTSYLPRIVAAFLIICIGLFAGDILKTLTARTLSGLGLERAETMGRIIRTLIIIVAAIIGIEQLGVDSTILRRVLIVVFGSTLGAGALAFGLGARGMVQDMLSVQQAARSFKVGDSVQMGDVKGRIIEFSQTAIVLDGQPGRILVPGRKFSSDISMRFTEES